MTESILTSVKKLLSGLPEENVDFDQDIVYAINSWFMVLSQVGAGPRTGFSITDKTTTWSDYSDDQFLNGMVKEYIVSKVRITFDPPQSNSALECLKQIAAELEWRILVYSESGN